MYWNRCSRKCYNTHDEGHDVELPAPSTTFLDEDADAVRFAAQAPSPIARAARPLARVEAHQSSFRLAERARRGAARGDAAF